MQDVCPWKRGRWEVPSTRAALRVSCVGSSFEDLKSSGESTGKAPLLLLQNFQWTCSWDTLGLGT